MDTLFASGRPRVPSYGYMENARFSLSIYALSPLMDTLPHSGLGEECTLVRATIPLSLKVYRYW